MSLHPYKYAGVNLRVDFNYIYILIINIIKKKVNFEDIIYLIIFYYFFIINQVRLEF